MFNSRSPSGQGQEFNGALGLGTVVPRGDVCFHSDREMQVVKDEANHSMQGPHGRLQVQVSPADNTHFGCAIFSTRTTR